MHTLFRPLLAGLLVSVLIQAPVTAAPAPAVAGPIGVVLQADRARIGGEGAVSGASIFDGDGLDTANTGSLQLRFGSSQAYLSSQSSAIFHQATRGFAADLTGGTIVLSAAEGDTFDLVADGARIRPATSHPTVAQVTRVSASELVLSSRKGLLEVVADGETKSISEGASYRMIMPPADPGAPQVTKPGGRNRVVWVLIAGAVVGTTVAVVLAVLTPCKPQ